MNPEKPAVQETAMKDVKEQLVKVADTKQKTDDALNKSANLETTLKTILDGSYTDTEIDKPEEKIALKEALSKAIETVATGYGITKEQIYLWINYQNFSNLNPNALESFEQSITTPFTIDSEDQNISTLKSILNAMGIDASDPSTENANIYTNKTATAVKELQKALKLPEDGVFTKETAQYMVQYIKEVTGVAEKPENIKNLNQIKNGTLYHTKDGSILQIDNYFYKVDLAGQQNLTYQPNLTDRPSEANQLVTIKNGKSSLEGGTATTEAIQFRLKLLQSKVTGLPDKNITIHETNDSFFTVDNIKYVLNSDNSVLNQSNGKVLKSGESFMEPTNWTNLNDYYLTIIKDESKIPQYFPGTDGKPKSAAPEQTLDDPKKSKADENLAKIFNLTPEQRKAQQDALQETLKLMIAIPHQEGFKGIQKLQKADKTKQIQVLQEMLAQVGITEAITKESIQELQMKMKYTFKKIKTDLTLTSINKDAIDLFDRASEGMTLTQQGFPDTYFGPYTLLALVAYLSLKTTTEAPQITLREESVQKDPAPEIKNETLSKIVPMEVTNAGQNAMNEAYLKAYPELYTLIPTFIKTAEGFGISKAEGKFYITIICKNGSFINFEFPYTKNHDEFIAGMKENLMKKNSIENAKLQKRAEEIRKQEEQALRFKEQKEKEKQATDNFIKIFDEAWTAASTGDKGYWFPHQDYKNAEIVIETIRASYKTPEKLAELALVDTSKCYFKKEIPTRAADRSALIDNDTTPQYVYFQLTSRDLAKITDQGNQQTNQKSIEQGIRVGWTYQDSPPKRDHTEWYSLQSNISLKQNEGVTEITKRLDPILRNRNGKPVRGEAAAQISAEKRVGTDIDSEEDRIQKEFQEKNEKYVATKEFAKLFEKTWNEYKNKDWFASQDYDIGENFAKEFSTYYNHPQYKKERQERLNRID
ncbi:MAG: peptidoglycan-binding domain-containing protein, partial [Candidatus Gracilibacteria bacterium]